MTGSATALVTRILAVLVLLAALVPCPASAEGPVGEHCLLGRHTDDQLVVYYFHRKFSCQSCEVLEQTLPKALESHFASRLRDGSLRLCVVNLDAPANRAYMDLFDITSNSVVIVRTRDGKAVEHRTLHRVWDVSEDGEALTHLLVEEVSSSLEST